MRIAPVSHHGRHPSGANVQVNALHYISNNEQNSLRVGKNNVNTVAMETPLMLHVNDPEPLTLAEFYCTNVAKYRRRGAVL